jgi:ferritin
MDEKLLQIIDESIRLELNVSNVYRIFSSLFTEHCNFWWQLAIEEKNHAALLKSVKECFVPIKKVPVGMMSPDLKLLKDTNSKIEMLIKEYRVNPPTLENAFNIAYNLEQSAGEVHYQTFMKKIENQCVEKIFQQLNGDDRDHAQRIFSYMENMQDLGKL